jgi:hypothetical protein
MRGRAHFSQSVLHSAHDLFSDWQGIRRYCHPLPTRLRLSRRRIVTHSTRSEKPRSNMRKPGGSQNGAFGSRGRVLTWLIAVPGLGNARKGVLWSWIVLAMSCPPALLLPFSYCFPHPIRRTPVLPTLGVLTNLRHMASLSLPDRTFRPQQIPRRWPSEISTTMDVSISRPSVALKFCLLQTRTR